MSRPTDGFSAITRDFIKYIFLSVCIYMTTASDPAVRSRLMCLLTVTEPASFHGMAFDGLKAFRADHMLDTAGILQSRLFIDSQLYQPRSEEHTSELQSRF